jgi:hypothetical protein
MHPSNGGDSHDGYGGLIVGGGALVLVLGGAYQATQASQASEATPYIAGVVAIAVALITWFATDRRQAKALAAERDRLQRQLDAEAERHRERLVHERQLANLDEVRETMDTVMAAFHALRNAVVDAEMLAERLVATEGSGRVPDEYWDNLDEIEGRQASAMLALLNHAPLVLVRVGRPSSVGREFANLMRLTHGLARDSRLTKGKVPTQEWISRLQKAAKRWDDASDALIDRVHGMIEAREIQS